MNGEEFLQSKDIWHHPRVSTRKSDISYDIAELLDEFLEAHTKQNSHKHGVMQGLQEKTIQLSKAVLDHINSKLQGYIEPSPSLNSVGVLAFDILKELSSSPTVGREGEKPQD